MTLKIKVTYGDVRHAMEMLQYDYDSSFPSVSRIVTFLRKGGFKLNKSNITRVKKERRIIIKQINDEWRH